MNIFHYNIYNYSLYFVFILTINGCNNIKTNALSIVIQSHNQNECYKNCHRNVIETLANVIEMLKQLPIKTTSHYHNPYLLLYKPAEHFHSGLGRFLECQQCNIRISYNIGNHALSDIYALTLGHRAYISGKALLPVL